MAIEDCDVFLSFRGETRNNFTCYLYEELKRQGFQPFMDRENIHIGDEIDGIIKKAIKYSKCAIVVLSENYASSKHCLNELVHILERNRTSKYFIIPVFYYVEAADVKYQLRKFGAAFEHVKDRNNIQKVEEWRAALTEVGDILAKEINDKDPRTESKIIEDIITSFRQKYTENYHKVLESQQYQSQALPTTASYSFDIEEGSFKLTQDYAKSITNKYGDMMFGPRMKNWMIDNPKFVIITAIIVTIIIIFTIVTFIQISIESNAADAVSSVFKNIPATFKDMDSGTRTETIWSPGLPWEKP